MNHLPLPKIIVDGLDERCSIYQVKKDCVISAAQIGRSVRQYILKTGDIVWTDMAVDSPPVKGFPKPQKIRCFFLNDKEIVGGIIDLENLGQHYNLT